MVVNKIVTVKTSFEEHRKQHGAAMITFKADESKRPPPQTCDDSLHVLDVMDAFEVSGRFLLTMVEWIGIFSWSLS